MEIIKTVINYIKIKGLTLSCLTLLYLKTKLTQKTNFSNKINYLFRLVNFLQQTII